MQAVNALLLPLQILLVDDDEDDCTLTGDLVSRIRVPRRAQMQWARSYETGLEALRQDHSDVCLLDYRLGARNGLELLGEARAQGYTCPIIVLTGKGTDGTDLLAMSLGADDYLVKGDLTVPLLERGIRYAMERGRHVHELRVSEARYRRLFEAAKDGILILAADTGRILDVNPFMTVLTGYPREHFLGNHLWDVGPLRDTAASQSSFAELQAQDCVSYDDLPLKTSAGGVVDVEFVSNTYLVDGQKVIQCNIRDITVRRRAEKDLRTRDRAIQAVSQGILISDARVEGNPIVYASPGVTQTTGYDPEEIMGRNGRLFQGPETDPASTAVLRDAIRDGRSCVVELLNYRKDGTTFWNSLAISPVRDADGPLTSFVGVQTDVTARRQLEGQLRQAQKMEAVGRLAGGVAHDFNNVLSVILTYSEMICAELAPEDPMRADVEEIRTAGLRATDLTKQLLAFSRRQVLESKVLNLNEVLGGMEKMLGRLLGAGIKVTILPAVGLHNVKSDPGQLEQIIMNLAVNARDAMLEGGQLVLQTANVDLDERYAEAHHDVRPGPYVELSVSDSGTGMEEATLGRIFEPFFTTKEIGKGTGLGLATVFGIVKQSCGHISAQSEPGRGTTFKIYLPKIGALTDAPAAGPTAPEKETESIGATILLVEDEDQVRSLARAVLRRQGYVILDAPNGGEALLVCEQHQGPIDLLLTDLVLPRMSGRQLAERLLPMRPGMKVLYMSGYPDDTVLQQGVVESGVAFLQKPLTVSSLTRKVREVLRGASPVALTSFAPSSR
jgi:two-component system cell cycle sensor histidine kinase/response regulator CckA